MKTSYSRRSFFFFFIMLALLGACDKDDDEQCELSADFDFANAICADQFTVKVPFTVSGDVDENPVFTGENILITGTYPDYTATLSHQTDLTLTVGDSERDNCTETLAINGAAFTCRNTDANAAPLNHNVELKIHTWVDAVEMAFGQVYVNAAGQAYKPSLQHLYLSNITLVHETLGDVVLSEVELYKEAEKEESQARLLAALPSGNYTSIRFGLGLNETQNQSDPALFPPGHPLSYVENNYWGWLSKYIFVKLEGDISSDSDGVSFEKSYLYHLGRDQLYRTVELPYDITLNETESKSVDLKLDLSRVFYDAQGAVDMFNENVTHSEGNIDFAERLMDNLSAAFSSL